jgi:hypothetical protein
VRRLLTDVCQQEGHDVTHVWGTHETLHYLVTSQGPLIAILEYDLNYPLFATIEERPQLYHRHRYVAIHAHELTPEDEAVLHEIGASVFAYPFDLTTFVAATREAAASLKRQPKATDHR